jgi:biotin--protein ligase
MDHPLTTYFNGGCHFVKAGNDSNVTVLATYAAPSREAAIIEIGVGKGRVILSGVHCEFAPELFDRDDPFLIPVQQKLIPKDQDRQALMAHLLERLGIEITPQQILKG